MRHPLWILGVIACPVLAGPNRAGNVPLREFFNPASPAFRLPTLTPVEFDQLDADQRLWARGIDPSSYFAPPEYDDAIPQAMNRRAQLHPGFGYRERMLEKQRFWRAAARDASLNDLLALIELAPLEESLQSHAHLTEGLDPKYDRGQPLRALHHSERMFRRWWCDRLGAAIAETPRSRRGAAIRKLTGLLRHKDPAMPFVVARVLGAIPDDAARAAVERAVCASRNAEVRAALMVARVRQGGASLPEWIGSQIRSDDEQTARSAVHALAAEEAPWALDPLACGCL